MSPMMRNNKVKITTRTSSNYLSGEEHPGSYCSRQSQKENLASSSQKNKNNNVKTNGDQMSLNQILDYIIEPEPGHGKHNDALVADDLKQISAASSNSNSGKHLALPQPKSSALRNSNGLSSGGDDDDDDSSSYKDSSIDNGEPQKRPKSADAAGDNHLEASGVMNQESVGVDPSASHGTMKEAAARVESSSHNKRRKSSVKFKGILKTNNAKRGRGKEEIGDNAAANEEKENAVNGGFENEAYENEEEEGEKDRNHIEVDGSGGDDDYETRNEEFVVVQDRVDKLTTRNKNKNAQHYAAEDTDAKDLRVASPLSTAQTLIATKSLAKPPTTNQMDYKKNDNEPVLLKRKLPKTVLLSWNSLTIKAKRTSWTQSIKSVLRPSRRSSEPRYDTILNKTNGMVEPGQMLALIGPSGSGKTSLLNALNFRQNKSLVIDGKIMLNGHVCDATRMAMVSSYIQQDDLFYGMLTVKEHLIFQAMLRMDRHVSRDDKIRRVLQVLNEFNLENCANVKIGIPGKVKGISGGEMRRLSVASEILTDPMLLFCDEPTSGLDSYMAKSIVYYLQKLAKSGKTIICTIHQPSSETFALFDSICILSQGQVAYFGPREDALTYFSKTLNKICPTFTNPCDFYMDVLGIDVNDVQYSKSIITGYCETFKKSEYHRELVNKIENYSGEMVQAPRNYTPYKASWFTQLFYLLQRCFYNYFRNVKVLVNDFLMAIVTALLGGLIYYKSSEVVNGVCQYDQRTAQNLQLAMFYTLTVTYIVSMLSAVMAFPLEIPIFYREHASSVYRSDTYYFAKLINELPMLFILPTLHSLIIYYMVGFGCDARNFFVFLFSEIMIANCAFSLGHVLSILAGDPSMAVSLTAPIIAVQMLFSGFFLTRATNTPVFLTYLKYISVFYYGYDLMMINQYETITELKCEYSLPALCIENGIAFLEEEKIDRKNKPTFVGALIGLIVIFRLAAFFVLWLKGLRNPINLRSCFRLKLKRSSKISLVV